MTTPGNNYTPIESLRRYFLLGFPVKEEYDATIESAVDKLVANHISNLKSQLSALIKKKAQPDASLDQHTFYLAKYKKDLAQLGATSASLTDELTSIEETMNNGGCDIILYQRSKVITEEKISNSQAMRNLEILIDKLEKYITSESTSQTWKIEELDRKILDLEAQLSELTTPM